MLSIGKIVTFDAAPRTNFCFDYIQNGAKCKVLQINPNTAIVQFDGQENTDIVSLVYLK